MGFIRELLGKIGDKAFGTKEERRERVVRDAEDKVYARNAYRAGKRKALIKSEYKRGEKDGSKQRGITGMLQSVGKYGESFSKVGEDMFLSDLGLSPARKKKSKASRGGTVTVRVVGDRRSSARSTKGRRKRDDYDLYSDLPF